MQREESTEEGSTERNEDRSRSRDPDEQPRERQDRRDVRNLFRSPRRRQPRPVNKWLPRSGYVFIPATQGESSPQPSAAHVEPAAAPTEDVPASREAHETPLPEDTDMGSDAGYGRAQVWNAPAIPHPPAFKESRATAIYARVPAVLVEDQCVTERRNMTVCYACERLHGPVVQAVHCVVRF